MLAPRDSDLIGLAWYQDNFFFLKFPRISEGQPRLKTINTEQGLPEAENVKWLPEGTKLKI